MNLELSKLICTLLSILSVAYPSSVPASEYFGELNLFAEPAEYSVETTVLLGAADRRGREAGYKLRAALRVTPAAAAAAAAGHELLLRFDLLSPRLHARSTDVAADFVLQKSHWDSYPLTTFYAHWKNGIIETSYLDSSEPKDILNYKKSLISLFQFQVFDGEHNETDISGTCKVTYESQSMLTVRKIKRECHSEGEGAPAAESRRVARYTWAAGGALAELHAEELHVAGDARSGAALKLRAWQRLTAAPPPAPPAAPPATLPAALAALPPGLSQHSLQLEPEEEDNDFDDELEPAAALAEALAARGERAGGGGGAADARAALRALPALRRAARPSLARLLEQQRDPDALAALCRLLGLAGTAAAHAAAASFLQLRDAPPLPLAAAYLAALSLSDSPQEAVVLDVLRLGAAGGPLARAALLAAGAAAARAPAALPAARDELLRGLAKCKDEEGRATRLLALGSLGLADTAEALLAAGERAAAAGAAREALAALEALRALPAPALLRAPLLARLERLALAPRARAPPALDVRAAALDLLVTRSAPAPLHLERTAAALLEGHPELRRVFWQRLRALADEHAAVRTLLRALPPRLRSWHAQAAPGTSSVLARCAGGWGALGAGRARLQSLQLAAAGVLRRGRVALQLLHHDNSTTDAVSVEVWTRGLEALAGGAGGGEGGEGGGAAEEAGGGLALAVGGARLPDLTLFEGQAELLAAVWAGRGSEATPALRAVRELRARRGRVPLAAGAALRWRERGAHALALDAQAQVSLWSRSARSLLELRGALAAELAARVGGAAGGAELRALAAREAEPRLRVAADLDFYDGAALCVRASLPAHERRLRVSLRARAGAHRVRREAAARTALPARTLALGAPNDRTCRTLASAED